MIDILVLGEQKPVLKLINRTFPQEYLAELTELYNHKASSFTIEMPEDYCEGFFVDKDNSVSVKSMSLVSGMRLLCRCMDNCNEPEEAFDKVLLAEEFPFTTESFGNYVISVVPKIHAAAPLAEICIVFVDGNSRKFGATDIVGIDKAYENASKIMTDMVTGEVRALISGCFWCDSIQDLLNICKPWSSAEKTVLAYADSIYKQWCDSVLDNDSIDIQFDLREFRMDVIRDECCDRYRLEDNVYSYNCAGSCDDLLFYYAERYYNTIYCQAYDQLKDFYSEKISSICFWNVENDIQQLRKKLDIAFFSTICPPDHTKVGFRKNAENRKNKEMMEYTNLIVESGVKDEFLTGLNTFFSKDGPAINTIIDHLREKANKILKARENI